MRIEVEKVPTGMTLWLLIGGLVAGVAAIAFTLLRNRNQDEIPTEGLAIPADASITNATSRAALRSGPAGVSLPARPAPKSRGQHG